MAMTIARLIAGLESRGILLSLAGEEIRYRSPAGALTEADRQLLRAHRGEIVEYLKSRAAARALKTAPRQRPLTPSVCAGDVAAIRRGRCGKASPSPSISAWSGRFRHAAPEVTAAIQQVMARYDALRARFEAQDGALAGFSQSGRQLCHRTAGPQRGLGPTQRAKPHKSWPSNSAPR